MQRVRRALRLLGDALAGRLGMACMALAYLFVAGGVLAYVSMQVYAGALVEDIAAERARARALEDSIAVLATRCNALASRERITRICRERLGMVEAGVGDVVRVRLAGEPPPAREAARSHSQPDLAPVLLPDVTEVLRR